MTSTESEPVERLATIGLVYDSLEAHRQVLQALLTDVAVDGVEFSVGAPLYKGSPAIKEALLAGDGGLAAKIDAYFVHGLVDDAARVGFARQFQVSYTNRHPRSERQDVFRASGDVIVFAFDLKQPMQLATPREAYDAIAAGPHDATALARFRAGDGVPKLALRVTLRLFLDFALNPRRHLDSGVVAAAAEIDCPRPYVIEVESSAAVAGYAWSVLDRCCRVASGRAVWLDT